MRITLLLAVPVLLLAACASPTSTKVVSQTMTIDQTVASPAATWGSSPMSDLGDTRKVSVTLPAGKHVYYVFTDISSSASDQQSLTGTGASVAGSRSAVSRLSVGTSTRPQRLEYLPKAPAMTATGSRARSAATSFSIADGASYTAPTLGTAMTFYDSANSRSMTVTLQYRSSAIANRYLNIWVANDCWSSTTGTATKAADSTDSKSPTEISNTGVSVSVNSDKVLALAAKFLTDGTNDVYGWDTSIFGKEWDEAGYFPESGLIDGEGEINIFITNLNPGGFTNGILEGYFDPTNNYSSSFDSSTKNSNQKILFALDANALADPTNSDGTSSTTWDITDYYPAEAVSTLAHEFQHMIHFYQKGILARGDGSTADTWINEMCSMLTEDLVSDKLLTPGPRGVPLSSGSYVFTTGASGNTNGRLPDFDYWHDTVPLTGWGSSSSSYSTLDSYANAYAFGAWLVRNYGGPALLRRIVQGTELDQSAVVDAVNAVNPSANATFASLVQQWGLATMLNASTQSPYQYSAASGDDAALGSSVSGRFGWTITDAKGVESGSLQYSLGSIDLSKYSVSTTDGTSSGPYIYSSASATSGYPVHAGASTFIDGGSITTATATTITLPPHVVLTVVAE
jgi:hypothetical protein